MWRCVVAHSLRRPGTTADTRSVAPLRSLTRAACELLSARRYRRSRSDGRFISCCFLSGSRYLEARKPTDRKNMKNRATVLCVRDGKILLVARERARWALPGGRIKRTEPTEAAASRELEEETGLSVSQMSYYFQFQGFSTLHHVFVAAGGLRLPRLHRCLPVSRPGKLSNSLSGEWRRRWQKLQTVTTATKPSAAKACPARRAGRDQIPAFEAHGTPAAHFHPKK